jgi:glycosyltransferase involved in cell wall biosynthesis
MRVLHVGLETTATRSGGLNRYFEDLVRAERRVGTDAVGVLLGDPDAAPDGVFLVAARPSDSQRARARGIDEAVRALGVPELADLHFAGTAAYPALFGALRRVPTVVHFQGPWAQESRHLGAPALNAAAKRVVERAVYRRADRIVALSGAFARVLTERYGIAPWSIVVLAPGVDLERFSPGDRSTAREDLGVDAARVVLCVRRLIPRMGIDVLLDAWSRRGASGDVLAVVGEGSERAALEHRARDLGLGATVRFCGHVTDDELVRWYRAADLTVVPSVALEGFGLVVLESAACGTPVVGTDAAGLAEALALVGCADPVPAGDADALRAAMDEQLAATDSSVPVRLRAAASAYGWDRVAARHVALYEQVLHGTSPRRVVVLDHTALLSGGELAIARAVVGLGGAATVHVVLATDGPLRERLERSGATVEVLALAEPARSLPRGAVRAGGVPLRSVASTLRYVLRLRRRLRELRPDVVHTNSLKAGLYGSLAARLAGVPCVWHVRDQIDSPYLPASAVRLVRLATRVLPDVVVANSASTLATIRAREGRVVPSPLDPAIHAGEHEAGADGTLRCTVLGRLAPWKGQDVALRAFARAFPEGGASLRVVGAAMFGEDDYASSLEELADELGIRSRVRFDGFVDDVAGVLRATDVLVHCSTLPEPFGQVVLEGMRAGCAVVVADRGGPAEVVTDGIDGMLYPMGSVEDLAACLRHLADDPALRSRLGLGGVATSSAYTPEALAPRLLAAWDDAVAHRGGRRARGARRG